MNAGSVLAFIDREKHVKSGSAGGSPVLTFTNTGMKKIC